MKNILLSILLLSGLPAYAHVLAPGTYENKPVLADLAMLRALHIPVQIADENNQVGFAYIQPEQELAISKANHALGRCAGYQSLEASVDKNFSGFDAIKELNEAYAKEDLSKLARFTSVTYNPGIAAAASQISEANLLDTVTWLSSYPNRYHKFDTANNHVKDLKVKLEKMLEGSAIPHDVSLISHRSTPQNSLRVRLVGSEKPNEIVVLGGHLDSINMSNIFFPGKIAPGADDNASGSADLIETLRVLLTQGQPKRTIEFFWYAGEEAGLLGSGEIAADYKAQQKDVVAVLQLDMTLFPGNGEFVIGNTTDNTSQWLRDFLVQINDLYLKAKIQNFACGYGCSDHASWFKKGYSTLMPFEATLDTDNKNIHTEKDLIDSRSNFAHAAMFGKIAVIFAMELANSDARGL